MWTTLSPGSGHRIAQAVRLLIETLPRRDVVGMIRIGGGSAVQTAAENNCQGGYLCHGYQRGGIADRCRYTGGKLMLNLPGAGGAGVKIDVAEGQATAAAVGGIVADMKETIGG